MTDRSIGRSLPAHAQPVTVVCEAAGTMFSGHIAPPNPREGKVESASIKADERLG